MEQNIEKSIEATRKGFEQRINYIYVNMIVIGCGIVFGWFDLQDWGRILVLSFLVAIVFIVVWCVSVYRGQKLANEMNRRLEEYQKRKE